MSESIEVVSSSTNPAVARPRAAYHRLLAEIDAVPEAGLVTINIDVPSAVTTALGALPEIALLGAELGKLPSFDAAAVTKLEGYALALQHAHVVYLAASGPPEELGKLVAEATEARELLLADVQPLAKRGLIPANRVVDFERSLGHRGVAVDVARLVEIMREFWSAVESKTALSVEQLWAFEDLSDRVLTAVGLRDQGPAVIGEATLRRQRAFTLFVHAYDEVRRGVTYLRHHKGDVDDITPSLYAGRTSRRKAEAGPAVPAPAAPAAPGLPGGNPFAT